MKKLTGRIANLGKYAHSPKVKRPTGVAKVVKTKTAKQIANEIKSTKGY